MYLPLTFDLVYLLLKSKPQGCITYKAQHMMDVLHDTLHSSVPNNVYCVCYIWSENTKKNK